MYKEPGYEERMKRSTIDQRHTTKQVRTGNTHTGWEFANGLSSILEAPHDIGERSRTPEILLLKTEGLSGMMVIIRVQHVRDIRRTITRLHRAFIITSYPSQNSQNLYQISQQTCAHH